MATVQRPAPLPPKQPPQLPPKNDLPPRQPPLEPRGPRVPPLGGLPLPDKLDVGDVNLPTGPINTKDQRGNMPPLGGPVKPPWPTKQPPEQGPWGPAPGSVPGPVSQMPTLGAATGQAPASTGALGPTPASGGIQTATGAPQDGQQGAGAGGPAPADIGLPPASGGVQTATGEPAPPTVPYQAPIPESQAGPIVDDLSRMDHGGAVSNKPGWSWYHTGAGGWVQAPTGQDPKTTPAGGGAAGGPPKTPADAFEAKLLELLNGPSPEEAAAGAGTSAQANAYRAGQQRNQARTRAQIAEENAAGGGDVSNPGLEQAVRGLDQQAGESEGAFVAQIASGMMADRRAELMQAMQMQASKGDADAARKTQMAIAQLDAEVRRRGYDVQQQLGDKDLELRKMLGLLGLSNDRYGINANRDTALDRLGYDYTSLGMQGNQNAFGSVS